VNLALPYPNFVNQDLYEDKVANKIEDIETCADQKLTYNHNKIKTNGNDNQKNLIKTKKDKTMF